eukprot:1056321-Amphidinium_carterae.1
MNINNIATTEYQQLSTYVISWFEWYMYPFRVLILNSCPLEWYPGAAAPAAYVLICFRLCSMAYSQVALMLSASAIGARCAVTSQDNSEHCMPLLFVSVIIARDDDDDDDDDDYA